MRSENQNRPLEQSHFDLHQVGVRFGQIEKGSNRANQVRSYQLPRRTTQAHGKHAPIAAGGWRSRPGEACSWPHAHLAKAVKARRASGL
jgi:hypothetical protein